MNLEFTVKVRLLGWVQWLLLVIPPTQEAEIRRIQIPGQSGQKVSDIPSNQ
jgi:hypothetical protein